MPRSIPIPLWPKKTRDTVPSGALSESRQSDDGIPGTRRCLRDPARRFRIGIAPAGEALANAGRYEPADPVAIPLADDESRACDDLIPKLRLHRAQIQLAYLLEVQMIGVRIGGGFPGV